MEITRPCKEEFSAASTKPALSERSPVDGCWGWVVCAAAFVLQFVLGGQMNAGGIVYTALMDEFDSKRGETAWVSSLSSAAVYLFAPVSTSLCQRYGCRVTALIGASVCFVGLLASSFCTSIPPLYLTYGLVWGMGASVSYFSTFVIVSKYFKARLSLANGIITCGGAIGGMVLSPSLRLVFIELGVQHTFRILLALYVLVILCSIAFRPMVRTTATVQITKRKTFDWTIFHNKGYLVYAFSTSTFMLGYLVPYVHLVRMAEDFGSEKTKASFLIVYMGIGSGLGRLFFGRIADLKCCNRLHICQVALLCIGVSSTLVPLISSYNLLACYAFVYGLFEGCYIMLNPVLTNDLVGKEKLSSALGTSYFIMAFPRSLGPPIAGWIYDFSKSYDAAFLYMGAVTVLASCLMFVVPLFNPIMHQNTDPLIEQTSESTRVRETYV